MGQSRCPSMSISGVVACTMFLSVGASLLGGLLMYFESISALHDTVSDVSYAETTLLATDLNLSFTTPMELTTKMYKLYGVHENVYGNDTYCTANMEDCQRAWHEDTKWFEFAMMDTITQEIGVVLPVADATAKGLFYSHVWYDLQRDGSHYYVHAKYGEYMADTNHFQTPNGLWTANADTYALVTDTGRVNTSALPADSVTSKPAGWIYDYDCLPYNNWNWTIPPPGEEDKTITRWRKPQVWTSTDDTNYAFMAFDTSWPAPPPPHPWSVFRRVYLHAFMILDRFENVVASYAAEHPHTTVVVYDEDTLWVYASSELNHSMVADDCADERTVEGENYASCKYYIKANTSDLVNDGYDILKHASGFRKATAGGSEMFMRKLHLFEAVHEGEVQFSAKILWMRNVESVSGQVERALSIFLIFAGIVFLVDMLLAVLEVTLIARPITRSGELMTHIGNFQLEEARAHFQEETSRFALREIRTLVTSILQALDTLHEYRTYLPPVLFKPDTDAHSNGTNAPVDECCMVFTDVANSVSLWEASWDGIQDAVEIHNNLMKKNLVAFNGYEVKQMGDAFMIAFQQPGDACAFCMQVQEELLQQAWPEALHQHYRPEDQVLMGGLNVRMGMHWGQVVTQFNPLTEKPDYLGDTVEIAAKAWSQALPGMVIVTQQVLDGLDEDVARTLVHRHHSTLAPHRIELSYILSEKLKQREVIFIKQLSKGNPLVSPPERKDLTASADSQTNSSWINTVVGATTQNLLNMRLKTASNAAIAEVSADGTLVGITDTARMFAVLQSVLTAVSDGAKLTGGNVVSLSGATSTISWGVGQSCSLVAVKALRYCAMLSTRAGHKNVTIGLSVGQVVHGNVGTAARRFNTVLGSTALLAKALVHHASKIWDVPVLCIMRNRVPTKIESLLRPVDVWGAEGTPPVVVEEVLLGPLVNTFLRSDKWEAMAAEMTWDESSTCSERTLDGKEYRNKFFGAVYGDTNDLMWLRGKAKHDKIVKRVVEHVKDHILAHPHRRWRLELPFSLPRLPLELTECGTVLSDEEIIPHQSVELVAGAQSPHSASQSASDRYSRPSSSRPSSRSSNKVISFNPIPTVTSL